MFSEKLREWTQGLRAPIGRTLGRLGATPNLLTVLGYLLNLPVLWVLAKGQLRLGGVLVALASSFDALDGTLARETGQTTTFGALFDSVMDRFSEATVLLGLMLWYTANGQALQSVLVYVTMVGSLMVSYVRARAEGLGLQCKVGLLTRFERVLVLVLGLLSGQVTIALWTMAVLANLTALQRVHEVWKQTSGG